MFLKYLDCSEAVVGCAKLLLTQVISALQVGQKHQAAITRLRHSTISKDFTLIMTIYSDSSVFVNMIFKIIDSSGMLFDLLHDEKCKLMRHWALSWCLVFCDLKGSSSIYLIISALLGSLMISGIKRLANFSRP